jgi:prepilin-type N-terminal cleavage/methylation domain-containing protein
MGRHRGRWGFTLVELMIVVVILGVLAAVSIPAYTRYVKRSKTTEATGNISRIYQGQVAYYNSWPTARFVNQATFTPDNTPRAAKYPPNLAIWTSDTLWTAIGFAIDTGHYYAYSSFSTTTTGPGAYFFARAIGNLDGDSLESTFTIRGEVMAEGEVQRFPLDIVRELE